MEENEFDVSDLAWLTYKVLYRTEIDTMDKGRLHAKFRFGETIVNMSGETDFNFGEGWASSISNKFEHYIGGVPKEFENVYKKQLEICIELYHSILNISLMPQTGNLQSTKAGIGNDRLDTFIWALSSYYDNETSLLFNKASFYNTDILKEYFHLFKINDDNEDKDASVHNYCKKIYKIPRSLVDEMILLGRQALDSPEKVLQHMRLAYDFWGQKMKAIRQELGSNECVLKDEEKVILNKELNKLQKLIDAWY